MPLKPAVQKHFTLGVDPGSRNAGAALFRGGQLLDVWSGSGPAKKERLERSYLLIESLNDWLWGHIPAMPEPVIYLAYEEPSFFLTGGQSRPIAALERFVGMLEFWGRSKGLHVVGYNVSTIKTGVAGRASASKEEVEVILRHEYNLHDAKYPDHIFDAISVGVYHLAVLRQAAAIAVHRDE